MMVKEIWLPVPGYEGHYEVSDLGRVRSLTRPVSNGRGGLRRVTGRVFARKLNRYGYPCVCLRKNGLRKDFTVHCLVLAAFVGPRPKGMVARHLNADRSDARLSNLCYGTHSENNYDRVRDGHDWNSVKTHCPRGHEYTADNTYTGPRGNRDCRACIRRRSREYSSRRKSVALRSGLSHTAEAS
ncbi:HNH endonuclease [Mycobacterium phage Bobi]|uniref:HNH endonuclease n=1 Tax=Mycobacterium phage Bobi TaxID=1340708 RepID=UPI000387A781|nr:HNH endonuclease [Mycobacterium phage Bobi]AGS82245.1 HNH endonuclease [Mycobacterium phage Bobi]